MFLRDYLKYKWIDVWNKSPNVWKSKQFMCLCSIDGCIIIIIIISSSLCYMFVSSHRGRTFELQYNQLILCTLLTYNWRRNMYICKVICFGSVTSKLIFSLFTNFQPNLNSLTRKEYNPLQSCHILFLTTLFNLTLFLCGKSRSLKLDIATGL